MASSLSVILPVHNAQHRLGVHVARLLDYLPDLTPNFDLIIVDDGSTDCTFDLAARYARQFPQVLVSRHDLPQGYTISVETGLRHTNGEIVLVHDEKMPVSAARLRCLWPDHVDTKLRTQRDKTEDAGTRHRRFLPTKWTESFRAAKPREELSLGTHVLCRRAAKTIAGRQESMDRISFHQTPHAHGDHHIQHNLADRLNEIASF